MFFTLRPFAFRSGRSIVRTWLPSLFALLFLASPGRAYSPGANHPSLRSGAVPGKPLDSAELAVIGSRIAGSIQPVRPTAKTAVYAHSPGRAASGANGAPVFLDRAALSRLAGGVRKSTGIGSDADRVIACLAENREVFRLDDPAAELRIIEEVRDSGGRAHLRFGQVYRGLEVWGSGLTVHLDGDGAPYAFSGRYLPTPSGLDPDDFRVSREEALARAAAEYAEYSGSTAPVPSTARPVIWTDRDLRESRLAWMVSLGMGDAPFRRCFVHAGNGSVIEAFEDRASGTPVLAPARDFFGNNCVLHVTRDSGKYLLSDPEAQILIFDAAGKNLGRGDAPAQASSPDNIWRDPLAVSAFNNARLTFEYYRDTLGRTSILGAKTPVYLIIHYSSDGNPAKAAFWAGGYAAFGDAIPYAAALDIVAHELTHGVVEKTVGLVYSYQSGALNEGFADFFGAMVDPDWEIGEDLPDGPLRDIGNPARFGDPADMTGYHDASLREDNGGVHFNMTIPARAGYLLAEAIGREKAARVWYSVLDNRYISPRAQFTDMRLGALQAATDLFGANTTEVRAVELAFDQVGIVGETWTVPPADHEPLAGDRWLLFMNDFTDRHIRIARADTPEKTITVTARKIFYGSASPFSVAENGSILAYIDEGNHLRTVDLNTGRDTPADSSGVWFSVEVSADGSRLAATRTTFDRTIYIFDLLNPGASKAIPVYTAGTEGSATNTARYVDAMDWDSTGTRLLFDAYHSIEVEGGEPIAFWDINQLDIESEIITRIKTPTEQGMQAGNPSYAETNDRFIVCDLVSFDLHLNAIAVIDLYTLALSRLRDNAWADPYPVIGHPRFSPDDREIVFQQDDVYYVHAELYSLPVSADRMSVAGEARHLTEGGFPRWFVRTSEPVGVEETAGARPVSFILHRNRPNPFNPETVVPYTLNESGQVKLAVFDVLGRRVAVLAEGFQSSGNYAPVFQAENLGSGVYHVRLEVNGRGETRRMLLLK